MKMTLTTLLVFALAALAEILGCFAFWAILRNGQALVWLVPGIFALVAFAWLLTLVPSAYAGRAYAAYGGIYIVASLVWLWLVEGRTPDRWDIAGGALAIAAAMIILFVPRGET